MLHVEHHADAAIAAALSFAKAEATLAEASEAAQAGEFRKAGLLGVEAAKHYSASWAFEKDAAAWKAHEERYGG